VFNSTNCVGGTLNGSANVTSVVPAGPYEYRWYNGTTVGAPGAFINGTLATTNITGKQGAAAANFIVEVTLTATGCKGTKTITIQDDSQLPQITPLNFTNNTNCTAPFNGTAFVNAATPFKYRGSTINGAYTGFTLAWVGGTVGPVDKITVLGAGSYTLQVTAGAGNTITNNNDNCISNFASVAIVDNLTYPVIAVTETDQTSCNPALPNGKLTATGDGVANAATHNFTWYDGVGTGGAVHVQTSTGVISALASSDYTVKVQIIATGCTGTQSGFVPNRHSFPSLTFVGVSPVTKCNTPDGSATVSLVNISAPAKYDLFYVFTSTISGAAYPTDPIVIKASPDPKNITNGLALPSPIAYGGMIPGYLTALVVDKNTSCESSPVTQQIIDNTTKSNITVTVFPVPGACGGGLGGMDPVVTPLAAGAYAYHWYVGSPNNVAPINFFTNLPTFGAAQIYANPPDNNANLGINHVPSDVNIGAGTYTLVVIDPDGCGTYLTDNVPTKSVPVFTVTPTDITRCDAPNGKLDVQVVSGASVAGYSIKIFSGNDASNPLNLIAQSRPFLLF